MPIQITDEEKISRLFSIGYFQGKEWDEVRTFVLDGKEVKDAVEEFRDFHGLPPGDMDDTCVNQLFAARCGLPDFVRQDSSLCKWSFLDVTCSQKLSGLNPLSTEIETDLYNRACKAWNDVCGIRLKVIAEYDKANIYSGVGTTSGSVLAYSYLPCGTTTKSTRMQQVYSKNTNWSQNLLLQVIIHEIGHAIGLDHGPNTAIMAPTANGKTLSPQEWDINEVVKRYGKPTPTPPPIPPTPPTNGIKIHIDSVIQPGDYELVPVGPAWEFNP
ncbi:MAG: matrixin family metalloprotease [Nitrososphaerales archaeon]